MHPKVLSVVETHRGRELLATVTLEVELADLEYLADSCDCSLVEGSGGFEKALDSAAALRKIRDIDLASSPAPVAYKSDEPASSPPVENSKAKTDQELVDQAVTQLIQHEEHGA